MRKVCLLISVIFLFSLLSACGKRETASFSDASGAKNAENTGYEETTQTSAIIGIDGDIPVSFNKGVIYTEDTSEGNYNFLLGYMKDDISDYCVLIENQEVLKDLDLDFGFQNNSERISHYDDLESDFYGNYNDEFFKDNSLVFFSKLLPSVPNIISVKKVVRNGNTLQLYISHSYKGFNDAIERYIGLLEVKKEDIKGINNAQIEYSDESD